MAFIDALFTATSAVCVTGLVVVDTATAYSGFGQSVILALIQLGGLGIMTFSSLILLVAAGRVSLKDRLAVQSTFRPSAGGDFRSLVTSVFVFTMSLEAAGTLSLFLRFRRDFPAPRALALAGFHSISAFCNAGFSLFSGNLTAYRGDWAVNLTLMLLIISGGLGFFVLRELGQRAVRGGRYRLSLHSKVVLVMTAALIVVSAALLLGLEHGRSMRGYSGTEKVLSAAFQAVTARTAGFNTVDLAAYTSASAYLLILLMFIGASPGSTGGGVKTSTLGVILAFLRSKIRARESVGLFRRTIPDENVTRAYTVISLAMSLIFAMTFLLLLAQPGLGFKEVLFEVVSAFGTVGLSLGITPDLSAANKAALVLTMYVGRVGPVTLLYAFSRTRAAGRFEYAEESVMIG